MKTNQKNIECNHFGFPIFLINAPHVTIDGQEVLRVDYNDIGKKLFHALPLKASKLTGAEIKFIRHHLNMTQEQFADWLMIERSTVTKWEKFDLESTNMDFPTEQILRLNMILKDQDKIVRHTFAELKEVIKKNKSIKPIEVNCAA